MAFAIGVTFVLGGATAHAQANFFQGKTIRVVRGGQPGDLFDLWTRHIAAYFGKHVPGHPSVMVQNIVSAVVSAVLLFVVSPNLTAAILRTLTGH